MFSTCIHCHAPLGANGSIEHFPVGRRVAFDADRGRLWAVCPRCARWNLAPIEVRWEAIEGCERAYRGATQRVSTDNIALARVNEGTDLVRIGRPLLPEYAAWRYGDVLQDRRRRFVRLELGVGVATALAAGAVPGALVAGADPIVATPIFLAAGAMSWWSRRRAQRPFAAALPGHDAVVRRLARRFWQVRLGRTEAGEWLVEEHDARRGALGRLLGPRPAARLTAEAARAAMAPLLAALAPWGANRVEVREASATFERTPDVETLFDTIATNRWLGEEAYRGALVFAAPAARHALEMALHEDDERRALTGELGALYARWEEAERSARIADGELTRLAATDGLAATE